MLHKSKQNGTSNYRYKFIPVGQRLKSLQHRSICQNAAELKLANKECKNLGKEIILKA
jgi:hypothetical protein